MEIKEMITLIGVTLTFLIGLVNFIFLFYNSRKTTYISAVTASRIKYIEKLRDSVADFCALSVSNDRERYRDLLRLKYQIRLFLDPTNKEWDEKMIKLIDEVIEDNSKINELITLTQFILKLEWGGYKREAKKGILSAEEKQMLNQKYLAEYEMYQ